MNTNEEPSRAAQDVALSSPLHGVPADDVTNAHTHWKIMAGLLAVLFVLAVSAAGASWYLWQQAESSLTVTKAELTTATFNLEQARQQVSYLEGQEAEDEDDEARIVTAAKNYNTLLKSPLSGAAITVTKKDVSQAIATITERAVSYTALMEKSSDGAWLVVWFGQGTPSADVIRQFDITIL